MARSLDVLRTPKRAIALGRLYKIHTSLSYAMRDLIPFTAKDVVEAVDNDGSYSIDMAGWTTHSQPLLQVLFSILHSMMFIPLG
jgi:hypothetical protein